MASPPLTITLPIFFLLLPLFILRGVSGNCHVDDETGLLGFKSGIYEDPTGMLDNWIPGTNCCMWQGVTCRVKNNRVVSLTLIGGQTVNPRRYLSGKISPSLVKLRHLNAIYLQYLRNLTGTFPRFLFDLPRLRQLYIEESKLSGPIPVDIGRLTRLGALSLHGNRFTGPIPISISQLTELGILNLGGNRLIGEIPNEIRNLKNLSGLSLDQNRLTGKIPDFFTSLPNLILLNLTHNGFTGEIPLTISSLSPRMFSLELGHNFLTGKIPEFLGNFKFFLTLDLSSNLFTGIVPKSFKNLTLLFNLNLSRNKLENPFPEMNATEIQSLDLSYNQFKLGQIPKWATSSTGIHTLKLAGCGIKMKLENWKPVQYFSYEYIDLSDNEISGSPIGLLNRTEYLQGFWAKGNQLKFNMTDLKLYKTLKFLDLSRNQVFGKVPASISGLEKVDLSHNHLCGRIPMTKFPGTSFLGNDCLCGSPLPQCKR